MEDILENNRLVAQFMGVYETKGYYDSYGKETPHYYTGNDLFRTNSYTEQGISFNSFLSVAKYHISWDWLMPACKKAIFYVKVDDEGFKLQQGISYALAKVDIEEACTRLVAFIEWFNTVDRGGLS